MQSDEMFHLSINFGENKFRGCTVKYNIFKTNGRYFSSKLQKCP